MILTTWRYNEIFNSSTNALKSKIRAAAVSWESDARVEDFMRFFKRLCLPVSILVVALVSAGASAGTVSIPSESEHSAATPPVVHQAKIKCGVNDDGELFCKTEKNKKDNKCAGENNCGKGFRDQGDSIHRIV